MRTVIRRAVLVVVLSGCGPVSIEPTYRDDQLISFPGLDGVWRDSAEGGEVVLQALDSVSYLLSLVEGEEAGRLATSYMTLRLARRDRLTFVDLVPASEEDSPADESVQLVRNWHVMPLHGFSLADVDRNRIALHMLDYDVVEKLLKRSPRTIAHIVRDDRIVLAAPTDKVQSFLIRLSQQPGNTKTTVYRRVPTSSSCEEAYGETLALGTVSDSKLLRVFGVRLRPMGDVALLSPSSRMTGSIGAADGLLVAADSVTSSDAARQLTLSRSNPLIVVDDTKSRRRLEIRWSGVEPGGSVVVRTTICDDQFPSSQTAREQLPPPILVSQPEGDATDPKVRFTWNRVPGATAYQLQLTNSGTDESFVVTDTTTVVRGRQYVSKWRVRAFAQNVGFGAVPPVHFVERWPGRQ